MKCKPHSRWSSSFDHNLSWTRTKTHCKSKCQDTF